MGHFTKAFYRAHRGGSLASARAVVPRVVELVGPCSVVDVGCGIGAWLSAFAEAGIEDLLGVDGAHVDRKMLLIEHARFLERDLDLALDVEGSFDLAVSLEVAEHLKPESASSFVASLTALAPAVLFSAAIPQQTGEGHVNEQWPDYWRQEFARNGYRVVDCLRGAFWHDRRVEVWYRQNMMLYVREEALAAYPALVPWLDASVAAPRSVVHPDHYLSRSTLALERPWSALARYYGDVALGVLESILPARGVFFLKALTHRLLSGRGGR